FSSVTLTAFNPMTEYLLDNAPEVRTVNYLDSYLQEKVGKEGMTDAAMGRMFQMLVKACEDGADGIVLTCTVFSPYVEYFSKLLSVPMVCPDRAMLEALARSEGKKAIICTFERTVDTSRNMYESCCEKIGAGKEVDMYMAPDAYAAAQRGDMAKCNEIVLQKVKELDERYDQIALAQISMSGAIRGYHPTHAQLYTSPASAYRALLQLMEK
ncbi:MAG: aspartate/glutamate racemase family protein, partial [Clostridiales bacterium]|nr:aspartate/glutamate racemase family protein [Clostridiales bacterium]